MSEEIYSGDILSLPTGKAWDMLEGEPSEWFSRFEKFRLMLPEDRSIKALFLVERTRRSRMNTLDKLPSYQTFRTKAGIYRWKERARESDREVIQADRGISELIQQQLTRSADNEQAVHRTQRRQVLNTLFSKITKAIESDAFDLTKAKNSELLQFVRIYLQQNREEFEFADAKAAKYQYNSLSDQELYDRIKERIITLSEPTR